MPYTLVQLSPDKEVKVTKNLESFFIFYNFNVDGGTKKIEIQNGYFAAHISQKSGLPFIQSLYKDSNDKVKDKNRKLEISNVAEQKIRINNLRLVNSRFSQFSNEVSQLHLFEFSEEMDKTTWIDAQSWQPIFHKPDGNDDGQYHLEHLLSFGKTEELYIYWLSTQSNENGTERIALSAPFIHKSLLTTVLSNHQKDLPKLQITIDKFEKKTWNYPSSGDQTLPGDINGFLMVAEGAFKSMTLSGEIDNLLQQITGSGKTSKDVIALLSQIVARYPTSISRTLDTASRTDSNAIIPSTPELPIEILYMEKLNSSNRVPIIIEK